MALFSMRVQVISRGKGRSVIAAAAYRAGERLHDDRQGMVHDFSNRTDVERTEMMLPEDAPSWVRGMGREAFWNRVDAFEKRKDAQTTREIRLMIPRELDASARVRVVQAFVRRNFVSRGMVADIAWHNDKGSDGQPQPHAHLMLTMRPLTSEGFGPKSRHERVPDPLGRTHPDGRPIMVSDNPDSWNCDAFYERCRESWEVMANTALEHAGSAARIDRRSYLERGIARLPEPALRLAFHLKELRGVMKQRFGQFQYVRFYRAAEDRAKVAIDQVSKGDSLAAEAIRTARRFHAWFDRQLASLDPERTIEHDDHKHAGPGLER